MKSFYTLFFLVFFFLQQLFGQWNGNLGSINSAKVALEACKPAATFKNVTSIEIDDRRPDTGCIGFDAKLLRDRTPGMNMFITKSCNKIISEEPFQLGLSNCLGKCLNGKTDSGYKIKIVIRDFWLNDLMNFFNTAKTRRFSEANSPNDLTGILIRADILLKKGDHFIPVKKIDTLISLADAGRTGKNDIIAAGLDAMISEINLSPLQKYYNYSKNVISASGVDSFYNKTLFQSALFKSEFTDDAVFMDAVSLNNMQPSTLDFKIERTRLGDIVFYDKTNGQPDQIFPFSYIRNGKLFIRANHEYCRVFKIGNRFYVCGPKVTIIDAGGTSTKSFVYSDNSNSPTFKNMALRFLMYDPEAGLFW